MIEEIALRLSPEQAEDKKSLFRAVSSKLHVGLSQVNDVRIKHRSIDARQKDIKINLTVLAAIGEDEEIAPAIIKKEYKNLPEGAPEVIIVGAGPAGLFAALKAIELGLKPILIERGDPVDSRAKKLAKISREGIVDPDTNYCFGEGGAGAYSDGKLFTRSKKKGNVNEILQILHQFGADEDILIDSHAHIGSNMLPLIIKNIRETIKKAGGEVKFNTRMADLIIEDNEAKGILTDSGDEIKGPVILATGHSAKDIYHLFAKNGLTLENKGFAMGVRVEHPQKAIDMLRYGGRSRESLKLPPAEYSYLVRIDDRAVYSFCMCPGGVIVPSMSSPEESLVNGMSSSGRTGKWANSAFVVEILPEDLPGEENDPLKLLKLQEKLEKDFYNSADKTLKAPAQRLTDFIEGKESITLPESSYPAGLVSKRVDSLLPRFISRRLKEGLQEIGKKAKGFIIEDATVIGLESRTSSPVRIPRNPETLEHVQVKNLFPAGEGAGYSGGIVSSAIDGQRCVMALYEKLKNERGLKRNI